MKVQVLPSRREPVLDLICSRTVRALCEAGANKDQAAHNGRTPLEVAEMRGHSDLAKYLRELSVRDAMRRGSNHSI